MRPNFEEMSRRELRDYVLEHREDMEAFLTLMRRRNPPDSEATWYPAPCTADGVPIEENIRVGEEAIRQRVEKKNNTKKDISS